MTHAVWVLTVNYVKKKFPRIGIAYFLLMYVKGDCCRIEFAHLSFFNILNLLYFIILDVYLLYLLDGFEFAWLPALRHSQN